MLDLANRTSRLDCQLQIKARNHSLPPYCPPFECIGFRDHRKEELSTKSHFMNSIFRTMSPLVSKHTFDTLSAILFNRLRNCTEWWRHLCPRNALISGPLRKCRKWRASTFFCHFRSVANQISYQERFSLLWTEQRERAATYSENEYNVQNLDFWLCWLFPKLHRPFHKNVLRTDQNAVLSEDASFWARVTTQ